jgi:hypothetical protein
MSKKLPLIQTSIELDRFVMKFDSNRKIDMQKVNNWIEIFMDPRQREMAVYMPAVVTNEGGLFNVGDGQHRTKAKQMIAQKKVPAKHMDNPIVGTCLPVYYVVCPDLTVLDIQKMNEGSQWTSEDFLHSFCSNADNYAVRREYRKLRRFRDKWQIPLSVAVTLTSDQNFADVSKSGNYVMETKDEGEALMEHALAFSHLTNIRKATFLRALHNASKCKAYNFARMERNVSSETIKPSFGTNKEAILWLEQVYNKRGKKTFFFDKNHNKCVFILEDKEAKRKAKVDKRKAERVAKKAETVTTPKRGRGRPPKTEVITTPKRGRGRPRKTPVEVTTEPKRSRPSKNSEGKPERDAYGRLVKDKKKK